MLERIFLQVLNMSFMASIVILAVMLVRLLLKKAPKNIAYILWGAVLFRLVCPFSFESALSILPAKTSPIPSNIMYDAVPKIDVGVQSINNFVNGNLPAPIIGDSANPMQIIVYLTAIIWLIGIAIMLIYSLVSLAKLNGKLGGAVHMKENIYICGGIQSPFVLGAIRPKIFLPQGLLQEEMQYIILHEQTHIRRKDHIIKLCAFFALCVHWFNPLVWVAFFLSGRDMEMACDESVIKSLGAGIKRDYSTSLLKLATGRRILNATPLAFGEGDTRGRIKNILNYKKPAFWAVAAALVLVFAAAIALMTNPKQAAVQDWATEIYALRTEYVGNNSRVANICGKLNMPKDFEWAGISLQTTQEPYGATVNYTVAQSEMENAEKSRYILDKNAIIAFSLIKNMGEFTISINNSTETPYTRQWAEGKIGVDLWQEASTIDGFKNLVQKATTPPENIPIEGGIESAVHAAIMQENVSSKPADFECESHIILATETKTPAENANKTVQAIVYALAMQQGYNFDENGINLYSGVYVPVKITLDVGASGEYITREYWTPRDGSYYASDIEKAFPKELVADALDTQKYVVEQIQNCHAQAVEFAGLNTENIISNIIQKIAQTSENSNPADWDNAEWRQLLYYGDYTLKYCGKLFAQGGQTDAKGWIMAEACRKILGNDDIKIAAENGQAWYDAFLAHFEEMDSKNDLDFMKQTNPKGYILLHAGK